MGCFDSSASRGREWLFRQVARLLLLPQLMGSCAVGIPAWRKLVGTRIIVASTFSGRQPFGTSDEPGG